jgi:outer membrane protein assembly factor BamB
MPSSSDPSAPSPPDRSGSTLTRRRALAALGAAGVGLAVYGTQFPVPGAPEENPPETLGPSSETAGDVWNTAGGGYRNSRHLAVDGIAAPTVAWSEPVRGTVGAVTAETAYLGRPGSTGDDGRVEARALADGSLRWRAAVPGHAGTQGLFGGHVYATVGTGVRSLDGGEVRWTTDVYATLADAVHGAFLPDDPEDFGLSPPVVADGVVHVRSPFGLHGLDADTGAARWRLWTGDRDLVGWRRPVLSGEGVYFVGGSPDDPATAVRLATAENQHAVVAGVDDFCPPPALGGQRLYAGPGDDRLGTLFSVPRAGVLDADVDRWTFLGHSTSAPGGRYSTAPAVGPDRAYVGDVVRTPERLLASVSALDPASGTVAWEHPVDLTVARQFDPPLEPLLSAPVAVDGTLYVGLAPVVDSSPADPGYDPDAAGVLALSTDTGERRWFQRLGFLPDSLAAADGALVAGHREHVAFLVDGSDG